MLLERLGHLDMLGPYFPGFILCDQICHRLSAAMMILYLNGGGSYWYNLIYVVSRKIELWVAKKVCSLHTL